MPGFDGRGPMPGGRGGGAGGGGGRRNRFGQGTGAGQYAATGDNGYVYEYTLAELQERKAALEEEIRWIEERMKEFGPDGPQSGGKE